MKPSEFKKLTKDQKLKKLEALKMKNIFKDSKYQDCMVLNINFVTPHGTKIDMKTNLSPTQIISILKE